MEIIEQIGSYAGLAAIVGLALLSALYFSQARDVRRLREWAGKAPERTSEPAAQAPKVTPQPVPRPPGTPATGNVRPVPAAGAAPVRAAATGATAAVATGPAAATPAAARVAGAPPAEQETGGDGPAGGEDGLEPGENGAVSEDTMAHPPPGPGGDTDDELDALSEEHEALLPADDDSAEHDVLEDDEELDDDELEHDEETGDRTAAPAPVTATKRPVPPAPLTAAGARPAGGNASGGSILPSYDRIRTGDPWYRRVFSSPGRAALVIAAGVLVLAAATLGGLQLADSDDGGGSESAGGAQGAPSSNASGGGSNGGKSNSGPAVDPASVTVAVLNGTTVQGAAQNIGDTVEKNGYQLGTVSNFTDQTRAESVVLFAAGAEREASDVMRRLKIGQREPIDAGSQGLAGDASVVVLVGADKAQ